MSFPAVECFWVEPNGKAERNLRRFSFAEGPGVCPAQPGHYGFHSASVSIGLAGAIFSDADDDGAVFVSALDVDVYRGDPRWPTHCACGYEFTEEDERQVNQQPIYESADGRQAWTGPAYERVPTPGAMFDTFWRPGLRKEDGLCVSVVCPDGAVWCVDGPANNGGYWTREGTVPKITVSPSIQTGHYHGFLQNGILTAG